MTNAFITGIYKNTCFVYLDIDYKFNVKHFREDNVALDFINIITENTLNIPD